MGQIQGGDEIITKGRLEAELQSFFNKIKPLIGTGGRQWPVMPQASSAYANIIVQYIGESVPDSYTHAHFYECVEKNGSYVWEESSITSVTDGQDGTNGQDGADGTTFTPSVTVVTNGYELSWSNDGNKQNPQTVTILNGTNGQDGNDGADGQGVPTGGSTGQILAKVSGSDYDTEWITMSSGGSSSGQSGAGGHIIIDANNTSMTARAGLKFGGDFNVTDDSTNDLTNVKAHRMTNDEWNEVMRTLPNKSVEYPVLFDEGGNERQVGWYMYSNGTKKPVYEKTMNIGSQSSTNTDIMYDVTSLSIDKGWVVNALYGGYGSTTESGSLFVRGSNLGIYYYKENNVHKIRLMSSSFSYKFTDVNVIFRYTKTTDTAQ